jgi:CheY-like chemotaxis protein
MIPHLLITDDDRAFRETLGEVFRRRGFTTMLAGDGEEALEIVRGQPVHLMLLDMHMPRLTGLETIDRLRQEARLLPWILLSGALTETIVESAKALSAAAVLSKPVRIAALSELVYEILRKSYPHNPCSN